MNIAQEANPAKLDKLIKAFCPSLGSISINTIINIVTYGLNIKYLIECLFYTCIILF